MIELDKRIEKFEWTMQQFESGNRFNMSEAQMLDLAEKEMREIGKLMYKKGVK